MFDQFKNIINRFFGKGMDASTKKFAFSSSMGNAGVQLISLALVFGAQIVIARVGGEEAYGTYSQVFNWIAVLFIMATFGSDTLLVKQIPIYESQGNKGMVKSVYVWTNMMVFLVSMAIIIVFALLVNFGNIPGLSNNAYYFNISLPGIVFGAFMVNQQAFIRGIKKVVIGQTAEKLAKPVGLILAILFFWYLGKQNEVESYVWANVFAFGLAWAYALFFVFKNRERMQSSKPLRFDWNDWLGRSFHLTLGGLLFMLSIRLDVLAVGSLMDNTETGYYNVALKYADMSVIPYMIISHSIAPLYSKFKEEGKSDELQSLFRNATRAIFTMTLFIFFFFVIGGKFILGFFGENYVNGYIPLLILGFGKLVSSFIGPIGVLMVMLGLEKYNNLGLLLQIILMSISLYILIPMYGLIGAATSTCLGFVMYQIILAIIVKKKMGINPTIFG